MSWACFWLEKGRNQRGGQCKLESPGQSVIFPWRLYPSSWALDTFKIKKYKICKICKIWKTCRTCMRILQSNRASASALVWKQIWGGSSGDKCQFHDESWNSTKIHRLAATCAKRVCTPQRNIKLCKICKIRQICKICTWTVLEERASSEPFRHRQSRARLSRHLANGQLCSGAWDHSHYQS